MIRECKLCKRNISSMRDNAVVCPPCKPKYKSIQQSARVKVYKKRKEAGLVDMPKPKPAQHKFPVGLREAYNAAVDIDNAVRGGRCCRHIDREGLRKGMGLCAECWGVKEIEGVGK